ncbi:acetylserotonin O-methyltransferase [Streptomyces platensis]|uniref:methyltransferase n=1 Tax=Streptomyces platensis TaxID=58346 RepID=UPI002E0FE8AC|nr:methyltransferase [Streptomyces platensis]WSI57213.1 acetylserotonin O-methyltransferase [Streptomyces platensis]WTI52738.1 acetylserotonin O-methyltransferase [Streptomyces platensis]WUB81655.1 acetylserotonin O-methyltransferase [Streptomyces platensis]
MATSPNRPTGESRDLMAPLMDLALGHLFSAALRTAAHHRLADHLAEGPRTAEQLAAKTGTHAPHLRRVLRYLATRGIFREDAAGAYQLTPAAQPLRTDVPDSLHAAVLMTTDELFLRTSAAMPEAVEHGGASFERFFGAPLFAHLVSDPAARRLFDDGMSSLSAPVDEAVAAVYPFPSTGTVVDIGGGRGGLLRAALCRHPQLTGVLFDQAPPLAHHLLDGDELKGRWRTQEGDFFASVPEGGDLYVLKHVLHNWADEPCRRILRSCHRAMTAGSRLLVIESVLPPGNAPHFGKTMDVAMMTLLDGQERTAEEFATLLSAGGFRLTRVLPTSAFPSIVEAVAE